MINGLQFIESILFWIGIALLFSAFVSACMESRHGGDADTMRSKLMSGIERVSLLPIGMVLIFTLRVIRDAIDHLVSEFMTDFDVSSVSAPFVMTTLSILVPVAAAINAFLGGSPFLFILYVCTAFIFFILGMFESVRKRTFIFGLISVLATIIWLVFAPFYAALSLTDHIMKGTFSHSVLGGILVAAVVYAACAGVWLLYRGMRQSQDLSSFDMVVSYFLFAIPFFYVVYWFGLLAGHFAINEVSPIRDWNDLVVVVGISAASFAAMSSTVKFGVQERRQGHGLAVLLAAGVVALTCVVTIQALLVQGLPFWLTVWQYDFQASDIVLDGQFWISHSPFFLWVVMMLFILLMVVSKIVTSFWPGGAVAIQQRPFFVLSGICVMGAMIIFIGMSLIDVYVNVN